MKTCVVEGCECEQSTRDMCEPHYQRAWRRGTLPPLPTPADRLATKLVLMPNGCLEWTKGTSRDGYGRISVNGKYVRTHRLAWTLANGPIPDGLNVLHHCDNRLCAQTEPTEGFPEGHLFLGTNADNSADMAAKGRAGPRWGSGVTHCPQGHEYAAANTYVWRGTRSCRTCHRIEAATRMRLVRARLKAQAVSTT